MKTIGKKYGLSILKELNNVATFYKYDEDKAFWFTVYLELAAAISKYPYLSAKNSDFKDNMEEIDFPLPTEREIHRTYGTK